MSKTPQEAIQRYYVCGTNGPWVASEHENGEWVKYSDHTAALADAARAQISAGWTLVPAKPTQAMIQAAHQSHEGEAWLPHSLYTSMIAAAPAPLKQAPPVKLDGPELWEIVFRVLKGDVPDALTDEALSQIASDISKIGYVPAPSQTDRQGGGRGIRKMAKTHIVIDAIPSSMGKSFALCGLSGWMTRDSTMEFDTAAGGVFESVGKQSHLATCKKCRAIYQLQHQGQTALKGGEA